MPRFIKSAARFCGRAVLNACNVLFGCALLAGGWLAVLAAIGLAVGDSGSGTAGPVTRPVPRPRTVMPDADDTLPPAAPIRVGDLEPVYRPLGNYTARDGGVTWRGVATDATPAPAPAPEQPLKYWVVSFVEHTYGEEAKDKETPTFLILPKSGSEPADRVFAIPEHDLAAFASIREGDVVDLPAHCADWNRAYALDAEDVARLEMGMNAQSFYGKYLTSCYKARFLFTR